MKDICKDSLESGQEGPEKCKNETPYCEVVISVSAADDSHQTGRYQIIGVGTDASATPSITGIRLSTLRVVNLLPNMVVDRIMVKIGVAARTTWWN